VNVATAQPVRPYPHLDADGLLRVGSQWVTIPDSQVSVVEMLLDRPNRIVSHRAIVDAYVRAGGSDGQAALQSMMNRLGRRFAQVGLDLCVVRSRGALLAWEDEPDEPTMQ
jgi:DNA-binding winged helix-turn-helix (wHTH) protein